MKTIPLDAVPVLAQTVGEMLASIGRPVDFHTIGSIEERPVAQA